MAQGLPAQPPAFPAQKPAVSRSSFTERTEPHKTAVDIYGVPAIKPGELETFHNARKAKILEFYQKLLTPVASFLPGQNIAGAPDLNAPANPAAITIKAAIDAAKAQLELTFDAQGEPTTEMAKIMQKTLHTVNGKGGTHSYNAPDPKVRAIQARVTREKEEFTALLQDATKATSAKSVIETIRNNRAAFPGVATMSDAQFNEMIAAMEKQLADLVTAQEQAVKERQQQNEQAQLDLLAKQAKTARLVYISKELLGKNPLRPGAPNSGLMSDLDLSNILNRPAYYYKGHAIYNKEGTFMFPHVEAIGPTLELLAAHGYTRVQLLPSTSRALGSTIYRQAIQVGLTVDDYIPSAEDLDWEIVYRRTESIKHIDNPVLQKALMDLATSETNFFSKQSVLPTTFTDEQIAKINAINFNDCKDEAEVRTKLNAIGHHKLPANWTKEIKLPNLKELKEGQNKIDPIKNANTYKMLGNLERRNNALKLDNQNNPGPIRAALINAQNDFNNPATRTLDLAKTFAGNLKTLASYLHAQLKDLEALRGKLANKLAMKDQLIALEQEHLAAINQCRALVNNIHGQTAPLATYLQTQKEEKTTSAADKVKLTAASNTLAEARTLLGKCEEMHTALNNIHNCAPQPAAGGPAPP